MSSLVKRIPRHFPSRALASFVAVLVSGALFSASANAGEEEDEKGFVPLFNGTDLTGWEGDMELWKVREGMIVGDSPGIRRNEFLATKKTYGDFELRLEFRMRDGQGNSGVQFRSKREEGTSAVIGYQADLGQQYWGCLYDEHRRNKVLMQAPPELDKVLKKDDWNTYVIQAKGDHVTLTLNGLKTVDYKEPDEKIARDGIIALQIHSGPAMRMEFRKIRIRAASEQ